MPNGPKGTNPSPYMALRNHYNYVTPPRPSLPAGCTVRLRFKNQARPTRAQRFRTHTGNRRPTKSVAPRRTPRPAARLRKPLRTGMKKPEYGRSVTPVFHHDEGDTALASAPYLISIRRMFLRFSSSVFLGMSMVSTPFSIFASMLSTFTLSGSIMRWRKLLYENSRRR